MEGVVNELFPESHVLSQVVAHMDAVAIVPPKIYVRLMWKRLYPTVIFDDRNPVHRLQIKDNYLQIGVDHRGDPLFKDALGLSLA